MSDSQDLPVPQQSGPGLEQSSEHVELKVWDVIIAGQVYGGLECHGLQTWKLKIILKKSIFKRIHKSIWALFQTWADGVNLVQC